MRKTYNLDEMLAAPNARESFALIGLIKDNPKVMDDQYVESLISQLEELGSGEVFIDFARAHVSGARYDIKRAAEVKKAQAQSRPFVAESTPAAEALRELTAEHLAYHHVVHYGCVSLGDPCMYNNGPCCCTAGQHIGDCPFRQGSMRLDEDFVKEQMSKLKLQRHIEWAENNIRRASILIKRMEEEINSSTC